MRTAGIYLALHTTSFVKWLSLIMPLPIFATFQPQLPELLHKIFHDSRNVFGSLFLLQRGHNRRITVNPNAEFCAT